MMIIKPKTEKGFTLIEVIVTVAVFSMIAYGLYALVSNILVSSNKQSLLLSGQDQARKVANTLTNELRNAATGNNGAYSIGQADNQTLVFYSNIDGGTDVERIRYFVQSGTMRKGVIKFAAGTYNPVSETIVTIQNDLGNGASPLFYYYDGAHNGTVDNFLTQPVNINQIKYIRLNLQVINKGGNANIKTYAVTAGATIRNLKTNLGN